MKIKILILLLVTSLLIPSYVFSADKVHDTVLIKNLLTNPDNYAYGLVSTWQLFNPESFDKFNFAKSQSTGQEQQKRFDTTGIPDTVKKYAKDQWVADNSIEAKTLARDIQRNFGINLTTQKIDALLESFQTADIKTIPINIYVVTSKVSDPNQIPGNIIAVIVAQTSDESRGPRDDLSNVDVSNVIPKERMMEMKEIPNDPKSITLYDKVLNEFYQKNVLPVTDQIRGTFRIKPAPPGLSMTLPIIPKNDKEPERFEQQFIRISEGFVPFTEKNQEIIISPDLYSWRLYNKMIIERKEKIFERDALGNYVIDQETGDTAVKEEITIQIPDPNRPTNDSLPKIGLELRYGIDELNYYSFWSNRVSLNVIWDNMKVGVILPTNLYAPSFDNVFNCERKLRSNNFGLYAQSNFAFARIPNSGVFQVGGGIVFGDPDRIVDSAEYTRDYQISFHAQAHYSFGARIGNNYWFRFGVGGTFYQIRTFENSQIRPDTAFVYREIDSKFMGGLSGKIEFMATNVSTPYGFSIQYLSEGLGAGGWLEVPITKNLFDALGLDLKFELKAYTKIFSQPEPWEIKNYFVFMPRLIVRF